MVDDKILPHKITKRALLPSFILLSDFGPIFGGILTFLDVFEVNMSYLAV